jgi:hypothetical protein
MQFISSEAATKFQVSPTMHLHDRQLKTSGAFTSTDDAVTAAPPGCACGGTNSRLVWEAGYSERMHSLAKTMRGARQRCAPLRRGGV